MDDNSSKKETKNIECYCNKEDKEDKYGTIFIYFCGKSDYIVDYFRTPKNYTLEKKYQCKECEFKEKENNFNTINNIGAEDLTNLMTNYQIFKLMNVNPNKPSYQGLFEKNKKLFNKIINIKFNELGLFWKENNQIYVKNEYKYINYTGYFINNYYYRGIPTTLSI
jgi:hypothetical protein